MDASLRQTLLALDRPDEYALRLADADFWAPYVCLVCRREGLEPPAGVTPGKPGTYPTFVLDSCWVVKFFGAPFDGGHNFAIEDRVGRWLEDIPALPAAALRAAGTMFAPDGGWPWPYLVFRYLPGKALSEAGDCLSEPGWDELADSLGRMARLLHGTTPPGAPLFPDSWPPFVGFLARQRAACVENQRRWGSLPAHLVDQIQDYLLPAERLIEAGREPHLVHADLTGDHLLGWVTDGRWSTSGLIDFGDALSGSLFYELPALYFNLLRGSPRRLAQFMQAYRPDADAWRDFVPRAMTAALLHRFDVFADLFLYRPELAGADSLQSLAAELWRLPEVGA